MTHAEDGTRVCQRILHRVRFRIRQSGFGNSSSATCTRFGFSARLVEAGRTYKQIRLGGTVPDPDHAARDLGWTGKGDVQISGTIHVHVDTLRWRSHLRPGQGRTCLRRSQRAPGSASGEGASLPSVTAVTREAMPFHDAEDQGGAMSRKNPVRICF